MAARKPTKKPTKKPVKKPAAKKAVARKAPATRRPAAKTKPKVAAKARRVKRPTASAMPMHQRVSHPELDDVETPHREAFEIFKSYDRDGSGSIDRAEFARLLEALGQAISEEELEMALEVVDANHSGRISWGEFAAWWDAR